jgi:putative ABC transport system permease protein
MLFAGAAMLLLVSCATVAGLLVGDARARRSEVAVRAALGGSRWRLLRPVLLEQMLLAAAAAVVGVGLASWALPLFVAQAPGHLPGLDAVAIDGRVVAFASALAVATMIVFGLAPAVRLVRTPTTDVLAEGGRDGAPARHRVQRLVVASQIALSLVLIVGASLMAETLLRLTSSPLGFEPRNLVVVTTQMTRTPVAPWPTSLRRYGPGEVVPSDARQLSGQLHVQGRIDHVTGLLDRLSGLPGVVAAAGAAAMPFAGRTGESLMKVDDVTEEIRARRFTVTDGYFQAMGMPVLGGRGFDRADLGQRVAVVSEEFARRFLDGRPLGRRVVSAVAGSPKHVVVGVVPDVRVREFSEVVVPAIYVPVLVAELQRFALRTAGDPGPVLTGVRDVIRAYDPQVVVSETTTMEGRLAGTLALERFRAALSSVFGGAALVLATIGLYGLATRRVADRRRELAVRAAVGAGPADLRQLVFGDGLMTLAIGLVVGVPAASAASRLMSSYVFGVSPGAPHVLAISAAVLTAAGLGAMINPARRAARTDPMLALRE